MSLLLNGTRRTELGDTAATKLPEGWAPHFVREGETFYMLSRPSARIDTRSGKYAMCREHMAR